MLRASTTDFEDEVMDALLGVTDEDEDAAVDGDSMDDADEDDKDD